MIRIGRPWAGKCFLFGAVAALAACANSGEGGTGDAANALGGDMGHDGSSVGGTGGGPHIAILDGSTQDTLQSADAAVIPRTDAAHDAGATPEPDAAIVVPPRIDPRCATAAAQTMQGVGTADDPYLVCLSAQLALLGTGGYGLDKSYALGDDLDLATLQTAFATIGSPTATLTGRFDGQNHHIAGLTRTLISVVGTGATVERMRIVGVADVSLEPNGWGLLTGTNNGTIRDVTVNATLKLPSHAGLLVGINKGLVERCFSSGAITAGGAHIGGLIGVNQGIVRQSGSTVSVSAVSRVGGLVGRQSDPGLIEISYALGSVSGNLSVGGLLGTLFGGDVFNSYAGIGLVTGPEAGGLVGELGGVAGNTIVNCYASGSVTGTGAKGLVGLGVGDPLYTVTSSYFHNAAAGALGTALTPTQMKNPASFVDWDFNTIWKMDPTVSEYPSLRFQTGR